MASATCFVEIGSKADCLWLAYVSEDDPRDKMQMEALIQMLAAKHLANTVDDRAIELPPPSRKAADAEFPIGTIHYRDTPLRAHPALKAFISSTQNFSPCSSPSGSPAPHGDPSAP